MITRRTRIQLIVFAIITLLGVTYVGGRYAQLDRLIVDQRYDVTAHYSESGGIFAGAEVTYRGVGIGEVKELQLTRDGVDVVLAIDNEWDEIPADSLALVGNRSAVGEQYVELQPQTDEGPFLEDGSELTKVATPLPTEQLLADLATTVDSVDRDALRTTITELGAAFSGTGEDLQRIIDTGNEFIELADQNFDVTSALIRDSNIVLRGQVASEGSLRTFARGLSRFSTALVGADKDLRRVIDSGSFTADQLRTFLEQNQETIAALLNNLVTTGRIVVANLPGIKQLLVLYPYAVAGGYTVVSKSPGSGMYDAHFGLIMAAETPGGHFALCRGGYQDTDTRGPNEGENVPMNTEAGCTEPITKSNPRGVQNLPRVAPDLTGEKSTVIGTYDRSTGELAWGAPADTLTSTGTVAQPSLGEDSLAWFYLQPLLTHSAR